MANLQDRRRVLGPSDTQQLRFVTPKSDLKASLTSTEITNKKDSATIRPIFIRTSPVANASGSAFIEISADPSDVIQVQVSVHGPRPIRGSFIETGLFSVEAKLSAFSVDNHNPDISQNRNNSGASASGGSAASRPNGTSPLERTVAAFVESSLTPAVRLEQYPKSGIDVFVTILRPGSNPKALQAACVNAATVALVDAGISLRDLVTCGAAILTRSESDENKVESIVVDPSVPTVSGRQLDMAVSYMTAHNSEIVGMAVDGGVLSPQILETCLSVTLKAAKDARALINGVLLGEFKYKEQVISQAFSNLLNADSMDIDQ
ncbi:uncharacterized protein SAPINGB_P001123 [Magnusiomyces paraingens]|uniref:Exoribonuclease phosphorolytic domain-containing protein n=1 Tax=Magnusiomyces paraingens TaxID=2606893 RepID=A0A5E8B5Y1_9ASCO|nr:uncharacterized protein SAPINGB_P001123 [Saprochaete ingens]VVT46256.1 unnamed protein product [Saprochaete ingens]